MKKHNPFTAVLMAFFFCLLLVMVIQLFPLLREVIADAGDESSIVTYVESIGWRGVLALLGLSALQVIIPFIPATVVGVLAGLSYGIYFGPLIFLSGVALGNVFVMVYVRQLSSLIPARKKPSAKHNKLISKEKLEKIKRPEIAAFFLTVLPFVGSMGPYLFAKTKVSLGKYVIAVLAAYLPSTFVYVFLGDRIASGNYGAAILTAVIAGTVVLPALLFRKRIMNKIMEEDSNARSDG